MSYSKPRPADSVTSKETKLSSPEPTPAVSARLTSAPAERLSVSARPERSRPSVTSPEPSGWSPERARPVLTVMPVGIPSSSSMSAATLTTKMRPVARFSAPASGTTRAEASMVNSGPSGLRASSPKPRLLE